MMSASELRRREVINADTAEKLGFVYDMDIDFESGKIDAIIVPKRSFPFFFKKQEYVIPWSNISAIGKDIILVKLDALENRVFE